MDSPIVPWMVRHAAYVLTRGEVKRDGKTALQKMKGRRATGVLAGFVEIALFEIPKTRVTIGDYEDRFEEGV